MSKIYDTFMFFNELDLLEIRLNILDPYVDYFVISEATITFSGKSKPLYYLENRTRFKKFEHKIIHNIVDDTPNKFTEWNPSHQYYTNRNMSYQHKSGGNLLSSLSLNFQREVFQRDSVINPILDIAEDDDFIIMSDLDEIPNPKIFNKIFTGLNSCDLVHCKQKWFIYYLNNLCERDWFGTHVCKFSYLKKNSIDLLQYHKEDGLQQSDGLIIEDGGWHFSFVGGEEKIKEVLEAYSYQGGRTAKLLFVWDKIFKNRIRNRIINNKDLFLTGRSFRRIEIDQSFPEYLINNIDKYGNLIKK
jgi:beta-1,4-mannosyl-glycoprotein beta-1,4-N-acetylglucosaminyltransferase